MRFNQETVFRINEDNWYLAGMPTQEISCGRIIPVLGSIQAWARPISMLKVDLVNKDAEHLSIEGPTVAVLALMEELEK